MADSKDAPWDDEAFAALLEEHRDALVHFLTREAKGLARWETPDDLAQQVHLAALKVRGRLEWRGEVAFRRWIEAIARQVISDRAAYWRARKRDAGQLLRITVASPVSAVTLRGVDPADARTGPVTFTMRKDALRHAAMALTTLNERDQDLLRRFQEGATSPEIAKALGLELASAQRAIHRARRRFEQAFAVLEGVRINADEG
ncbi:MAG: sigma-70 family RNA polymerase sigma factor [Planctomycetes bacterium]|nr:sigma-70 family RNA polymerase sigma factor [Planctomycetota bacterium]